MEAAILYHNGEQEAACIFGTMYSNYAFTFLIEMPIKNIGYATLTVTPLTDAEIHEFGKRRYMRNYDNYFKFIAENGGSRRTAQPN